MKPTPRPLSPRSLDVGYPVALELVSLVLAAAPVAVSWLALDVLPSTTVAYFGPARIMGLPAAVAEARLWTWTVVGLWSMSVGGSLLLYRALRTTPIPILGVALFAHLAVLRAGVISMNLDPDPTPSAVFARALFAAAIVLMLGAATERWRSRRLLPPALVAKAAYDAPTPRDASFHAFVALGLGLPLLLVPTRVRVIADGVLVVTPVSHFLIPAVAITGVERAGRLQALFGVGINLAASPGSAVRIHRRRRFFPLVISVTDPDRFIDAVTSTTGDSRPPAPSGSSK